MATSNATIYNVIFLDATICNIFWAWFSANPAMMVQSHKKIFPDLDDDL